MWTWSTIHSSRPALRFPSRCSEETPRGHAFAPSREIVQSLGRRIDLIVEFRAGKAGDLANPLVPPGCSLRNNDLLLFKMDGLCAETDHLIDTGLQLMRFCSPYSITAQILNESYA
jgi:hypothetical protein